MMDNLWFSKLVAFAYQYQQEAHPYKQLLGDFVSYLQFQGSETVLDIGCGSGRIMRLVWEESQGKVKRIIGLDHSKLALEYAQKNLAKLTPPLVIPQTDFICSDISCGLPQFCDNCFDLITAGLSIQYAEHWDGERWTKQGYLRLLKDIFRVLKRDGQFVFSVNIPNPDFSKIAKESWREIFFTWRFPLMLIVAIIMVWQGKWLTKQANVGRFHYLPIEEIRTILQQIGFQNIQYRLTYAGLAWVVFCRKPN